MRKLTAVSLAAAALAGCAPAEPFEPSADQQAALAAALDGRRPGAAVSCVSQRELRGNRSVGEGILLFEGQGDTVYVNRTQGDCPELTQSRALVTRTPLTQLCRGDIVNIVDPTSGFFYGSCSLGDFVPYRRAG